MEYDARRKRPNHFQELRHTQVCDFVLVNLRIIEFSAALRQQSAHIQLQDSTAGPER
jgi:aminopeptidase-like protein